LHKCVTRSRSAPTGSAQNSHGTAVFNAGYLAQSFWQHVYSVPGLLGERSDLGIHIFRVQRHHIRRLFGLQQLLHKFE